MKDDEDSMLVQNKNPVIGSSSKKRNGVENVVGQVDELCAYSYQIRGKSANDVRCFRTLDAFLKTVRYLSLSCSSTPFLLLYSYLSSI